MKTALRLVIFGSLSSFASLVEAQTQTQVYGPWPGMMGWGCGMGWPWPMMFIFWIVVIAAFVYFVRSMTAGRGRGPSEESALDILKKRYARGEINKDEYERLKKDIS